MYIYYTESDKERFINGKPGEEGFGKEKSAAELTELEQMWVLDLPIQKFRGFIQGFYGGLY